MTPASALAQTGRCIHDGWGAPRSKSISWNDPLALAVAGAELSGREFLQAIIDGRLPPPPMATLIGAELVSVGEGEAVFRLQWPRGRRLHPGGGHRGSPPRSSRKGREDRGRRQEAHGLGWFFEPTVLTNVNHSMKIMREETFGPTLPIMRVESEEEAVRLANDSNLGAGRERVRQGPRPRRAGRTASGVRRGGG